MDKISGCESDGRSVLALSSREYSQPTLLVFWNPAINIIQATVNGESLELPEGFTVTELLTQLGLDTRALAVEVNQELKPRNVHAETVIADGDVLEIVTLVGGG